MGVWCVVVGRRRRRTLRPQPPPPSIAPIISRHVSCTSESTRRLGVSTSCLSLSVPCLAFCALCRLPRLCRSAWAPPAALSCSTRPILLLLSVCASCLRLCHLRPSPSLPSCVPPPLPAVVFPRRDLVPGRVTLSPDASDSHDSASKTLIGGIGVRSGGSSAHARIPQCLLTPVFSLVLGHNTFL